MAWRKGWLGLAGLVLAFGLGGAAPAADPAKTPTALNPQLAAEIRGVKGMESKDLRIAKLDIDVEILAASAVTTVTAQFDNPGTSQLEGDFTLDLPAGSQIIGYALDVNGQLRPGVLVGQRKAQLAYEATVRRGVDPGIARITRNNAFQTHIFPIFPRSGRTIQLKFATPLSEDKPYVLPLVTGQKIGSGNVAVVFVEAGEPTVTFPGARPVPIAFDQRGRMGIGGAWKDQALDGALTIKTGRPAQPMIVAHHSSGDDVFDIVDAAPAPKASEPPRSVRIYWDRSLSRRDDDLARETAFLTRYLSDARPAAIELVTFASDMPLRHTLASAAEVEGVLKGVRYGGATSLAGVLQRSEPAADVCLLFTDGRVTLDAWKAQRLRCTLVAVSTAPDADPARLSALARRLGGFHVDLAGADPAEAAKRLTNLRRVVEDITDASGEPLEAAVLQDEAGKFRIVGLADSPGDVLVRLRGVAEPRRYARSLRVFDHDGAGAFWGARAVADADLNDKPDQDKLVALARRWSVATPAASFIVLETVQDYANAGIEPPEMLGKEQLVQYRAMVDDKAAAEAARKAGRLDQVIALWDAQKVWWKSEFKVPPPRKQKSVPAERRESDALAAPEPPPPPPPPPPAPAPPPPPSADDRGEVAETIVTGSRIARADSSANGAVQAGGRGRDDRPAAKTIAVEVEPWNPDRPYLRALEAPGADFDSVYAAQQAEHGDLPAFYLDVAEWLFRKGRNVQAIQMALSALDMPQANTATLIIVADRMMRYGDTARGLWLYDRIAWMEPDRPQPHRNLALALIAAAEQPGVSPALRKARYQEAGALLNKVITTPWREAYNGIEVISLMEANALIPKAKAVGAKVPLDPRLVALLDVDIRVVLEWNTDASDMDLWVAEPTGEMAKYSNPKTAIGGRMSDDMTAGFGPEEYLLRKAPNGQYEIRVHVYRPDTIDPNGSTTVRGLLFRNYGRPDQSVERMEIDLAGAKEAGARLVGKFRVGPRPARKAEEE